MIDYMLNGRAMITDSVAGLIWKIQYKYESIFSWGAWAFWWECKSWIELNQLCNSKAALKRATSIDTTTLASKTDLPGLKTKAHNLDLGKLKTVPDDLSQLTNVVDNDVVKKTLYDTLVIKVDAIDIKIPSTSVLVTKA